MRIVIGSDHAGFGLKEVLIEHLRSGGHKVEDVGAHSADSVDYPDFAEAVGLGVIRKRADKGIVICGSGVGASVAANKVPGVRAGLCHDVYSARQGVEHDAMNVLVLGARVIGTELAKELVRAFLGATFSEEKRHARRLEKVNAIERRYSANSRKTPKRK